MRRAVFLEHSATDQPGRLGELAGAAALSVRRVRADDVRVGLPEPAEGDVLVVMGSLESATDPLVPWIDRERRYLAAAVALGTPVLGVCFGGQLLSEVLGGSVARAPRPELGWLEVETSDPATVPPGPWLTWHDDAFTVPPGAVPLARTTVCVQAFATGPHVGVQFHPEATPELVASWAADAVHVGRMEADAGERLSADTRAAEPVARQAAGRLWSAFLARAGVATAAG